MNAAYEGLLHRLGVDVAHRNGTQAEARCPGHEDRHASLSIGVATEGDPGAVIKCHAGCPPELILAAMGLRTTALFDQWWERRNGSSHDPIAIYRYTDESGEVLLEVGRFPGKRFLQRRPGRSDWKGGIRGVRRVLYRLPQVIDAVAAGQRIWVVEGEKDVDALVGQGQIATCNPGGAGKWRDEYSESLRGAVVTVIADRDDAGREHARAVARSLAGVNANVTVVEPPTHKDVSDHLAAGGTLDDLCPCAGAGIPVDDWLAGSPMDPCAEPPTPLPLLPGVPFMHPGMAAIISGPSGKGRSSVIQACLYDAARQGIRSAYLGSEVTKPEFNARAALLAKKRGDDAKQIRTEVAIVRYLDLTNTLAAAWQRSEKWVKGVAGRYDLVVIDPLNDALAATKSKHENEDYVTFYMRLVQPLVDAGVAVVILANVGHAEDAQERPIGPAAQGHKADLMFSSKAHDDPPSLTITLTKVRSIRAAFAEGATWKCDEKTLKVERVDDLGVSGTPSRPKAPREHQREQRRAAVLKAVSEKRRSARQVAAITGISRPTVQAILDWLGAHGKIDSTADGWGVATKSRTLGNLTLVATPREPEKPEDGES